MEPTPSRPVRRWRRVLAATVAVAAASAWPAAAQSALGLTSKGASQWPHYDAQNRLRSVIKFADVKATEGTVIRVATLRIEYYREDGTLEFLAEAPECQFNLETRTAFSAGPLQARSADGRFALGGRGFRAQQATSSLLLSNDVRATLRTDNAVAPRQPAGPPMEITAAAFELSLSNNTAVFRDNVRADDPQFALTSGLLTASFTGEGTNGSLTAIEVERDVVLTGKADGSRVTAGRARYTVSNELVVLTGNPAFARGARQGRAERVTVDRRTRALEAEGTVELQAPREELGRSGFLLSTAGQTNVPAPASATAPAAPVRVFARKLTWQSNLTVLEGDVRMVDGTNRMSTGRFTAETEGTNSAPVRARAENGLFIEQGARSVKAERANYERASESVAFHGRPEWKLDGMEGVADHLKVFPRANAVEASGDLRLKFLRFAGVDALLPVFTNGPATAGSNRPVEVTARRLTMTNDYISLTEDVQGHELPQTGAETRFAAGAVLIQFVPGTQRPESAQAVAGVVVEQGTAGVTNGPAAYRRFQAGEVRAAMDPATGGLRAFDAGAGVRVEMPAGWASGGSAFYDARTETVTLTNGPTAAVGEVLVKQAPALLWHRGNGTIDVMGPNMIEFRPGGAFASNALPRFNFR